MRIRLVASGLTRRDDSVDDPVLLGIGRGEDLVSLDVLGNLLRAAAGVLGDDALHLKAHPQDLVRLDLDVRALASALGIGLVDQDPRVRQGEALARRARGRPSAPVA